MNNILENYKQYPGITEAREVVKTVEVVHNHEIYQISVRKCYHNPPVYYDVDCWRYESVVLQQSDITGGKYEREPERMVVLVKNDLPWVHMDDPEKALHQALNFLTGVE